MNAHELADRLHDGDTPAADVPPIVLIVDDHTDTLDIFDSCLTARGYWVARATTALEALECAQDIQPDAIVTDVSLEGDMDGTDLIRELHADDKLRNVPVLVVTGRDPRALPSFSGLSISGLLLKPVATATLVSRVEQVLHPSVPAAATEEVPAAAPPLDEPPVAVPELKGAPRAAGKVDKRHRECPRCGTRLTWVEMRRLRGVAFDYYRPCSNGCGLSCFNRDAQAFEFLITSS
jgi:DNA-binding response OmpR family regulator